MYREGNGMTCILYTVLISEWQLQYQTISTVHMVWETAYTQFCYQNESMDITISSVLFVRSGDIYPVLETDSELRYQIINAQYMRYGAQVDDILLIVLFRYHNESSKSYDNVII